MLLPCLSPDHKTNKSNIIALHKTKNKQNNTKTIFMLMINRTLVEYVLIISLLLNLELIFIDTILNGL